MATIDNQRITGGTNSRRSLVIVQSAAGIITHCVVSITDLNYFVIYLCWTFLAAL